MSSGLMKTEVGGEQTQYEGEHEAVKPTSKSSGQLGGDQSHTSQPLSSSEVEGSEPPSRTAEAKAEKIRFGQAISERGGVSGMTAPSQNSGSANQDGVFGGSDGTETQQPGQSRSQQGYDAKNEMDREVGA